MALLRCNFRSALLDMEISAYAALPDGEKGRFKTLYMFHGKQEDCTKIHRTMNVEEYYRRYHLAIIMPDLDMEYYSSVCSPEEIGHHVWTELPRFMQTYLPLSRKEEDSLLVQSTQDGCEIVPFSRHSSDVSEIQLSPAGREEAVRKAIEAFFGKEEASYGTV